MSVCAWESDQERRYQRERETQTRFQPDTFDWRERERERETDRCSLYPPVCECVRSSSHKAPLGCFHGEQATNDGLSAIVRVRHTLPAAGWKQTSDAIDGQTGDSEERDADKK